MDESEQAMRLIGNSCRKEQLICPSVIRRAASESQGPQSVDRQRIPFGIDHLPVEAAVRGVERVDASIAEIPNQQLVAKLAEVYRRQRQAPRRVQRSVRSKATNHVSFGVEYVYVSISRTGLIVVLVRHLRKRKGDPQLAINVLDAEGRKVRIYIGIREGFYQSKALVIYLHDTSMEIGRIDEITIRGAGYGQSFVHRARAGIVLGDHRTRQIHVRIPSQDGSILSGEEEKSGPGFGVLGNHEIETSIEYDASGRAARRRGGRRDPYDEGRANGESLPMAIVER